MSEMKISDNSMAARRQIILDMLNRNGSIRVVDLSHILNTSVVTIRKDLDELEREGLLERMHGGAMKNNKAYQYNSFTNRLGTKAEEKQKIAAAAADMINEGDSIIINTGSTTFYVVQELKKKNNVIVITNSLQVFNEIGFCKNITTIFLGGKFDPVLQVTYGNEVISQLSEYMADKLIMGIDGIDLTGGLTSYDYSQVAIARHMIERSKHGIIVADDSKIGRIAFSHICSITNIETIITNDSPNSKALIKDIRNLDIQVEEV